MRSRVILCLAGAALVALAVVSPSLARSGAAFGPQARASAPAGGWKLKLIGNRTKVLPIAKVPAVVKWDGTKAGNINKSLRYVYKGQLLYKLVGMVDDTKAGFNAALAKKGYTIQLFGLDGYKQSFSSKVLFRKGKLRTDLIVAKIKAGKPLPASEAPFRFVGGPPITQPFNCKLSAFMLFKIRLIF